MWARTESVSSVEVRAAGVAGAAPETKSGKRRRHKKAQQEPAEEKGKRTHRIITATSDHMPNTYIGWHNPSSSFKTFQTNIGINSA